MAEICVELGIERSRKHELIHKKSYFFARACVKQKPFVTNLPKFAKIYQNLAILQK